MAKKRITLPGNFQELLEAGDVERLKKVFEKCEVNAKPSRYGSNAFGMAPLPREFAFWLKEQGGDVNQPDYYGNPPIFNHASFWQGDVGLLIELGADIHVTKKDGTTPLHLAAAYGRADAVKQLLEHGADVNVRMHDEILGNRSTPLEMALTQARVPLKNLLAVCKILLEHGADITEAAKKAVAQIGMNFERRGRRGITDSEFLEQQVCALNRLYEIFDVPPAEPVEVHDGVSPIIICETGFVKQYRKMWDYLVPPSGVAKTAQGEVIRIAGKVSYEILDNGGMNWDQDFRRMLKVLPEYFQMGNPLSEQDITEVKLLIQAIYDGYGDKEPEQLTAYAVAWVMRNQEVVAVIPPEYKR